MSSQQFASILQPPSCMLLLYLLHLLHGCNVSYVCGFWLLCQTSSILSNKSRQSQSIFSNTPGFNIIFIFTYFNTCSNTNYTPKGNPTVYNVHLVHINAVIETACLCQFLFFSMSISCQHCLVMFLTYIILTSEQGPLYSQFRFILLLHKYCLQRCFSHFEMA